MLRQERDSDHLPRHGECPVIYCAVSVVVSGGLESKYVMYPSPENFPSMLMHGGFRSVLHRRNGSFFYPALFSCSTRTFCPLLSQTTSGVLLFYNIFFMCFAKKVEDVLVSGLERCLYLLQGDLADLGLREA